MAFIVASAADTWALADLISEAAIGISLQSVGAIAAAGTDYVVGDQLTLSGGTSTVAAVVEVLTVNGSGGVLTVHIRNAGIYVAGPASPVSTTGGAGTGCTLTCTFGDNGWTRVRAINVAGAAQSATVAVGGTSYVVGNILTLSGGTGHTASTFRVATVSSGVVTAVTLVNAGSFSTAPGNPVSTTGGAGTGCTLTVTFGGTSAEREVVLVGEGDAGTDEIYCGYITARDTTNRQLEIMGFTGHDPALPIFDQPGMSLSSVDQNQLSGSYCPTHDATMDLWISVKPRRIVFVYLASNLYGSAHMGFLDPYLTSGNWAYPLYICGQSARFLDGINPSGVFGHVGSPNGFTAFTSAQYLAGAGQLRDSSGSWIQIRNSVRTGSSSGVEIRSTEGGGVFPYFRFDYTTTDDLNFPDSTGGFNSQNDTPFSGIGTDVGQPDFTIEPTPDSGGDIYLRYPCTVIYATRIPLDIRIFGDVVGVFAINSGNILAPQNRIREGLEFFMVFGGGVQTGIKSLWCLKEE